MAISHANCTHPRTPAGRAACRRGTTTKAPKEARQNVVEATNTRRVRRDTPAKLPSVLDVLRGLDDIPARVRTFLNVAMTRGLRIQPNRVERGTSFHVLSEEGAITVTWDADEIAWFARRGFSSLSQRIEFKEVWKVLGFTK